MWLTPLVHGASQTQNTRVSALIALTEPLLSPFTPRCPKMDGVQGLTPASRAKQALRSQ